MRLCIPVGCLLSLAGAVATAGAQDSTRAYLDVTLGANVLVRNGPINGEYYFRSAPSLLLALGVQPNGARSFVAAIRAGWLNAIGYGSDVCRFTPLGRCYEDHPLAGMLALTFGVRPIRSRWSFLELSAGPAYISHLEGGSSFGAFAVGRMGQTPGHYLSAGLAGHGLVTTIDGKLVFATGIGFSLRTW